MEIGVIGGFQDQANLICHVVMAKSILITGGARSGKSTLAERMTLDLGSPAIYLATAEAGDGEMAERIALHRARRGPEWQTLAEPLALVRALVDSDGGPPRLVDCLTLWLSNLMLAGQDWEEQVEALAALLPQLASPWFWSRTRSARGSSPPTSSPAPSATPQAGPISALPMPAMNSGSAWQAIP
ncbi:bifunctional cobinamide kinase/cobinamide phosphate guanyltransferase protein CobP [Frigidibacter mobilis]|uniref:Adenosylcobinamide kinase n=1 Tax=Frigidibacter mobilis TaxID=1335048 RepID=A0A159Z088_9RHOB|nr:bifunctional cobinamide kinase/cobinamide phosphate guanyltransferase protein CobP [Frigidibacter mobilis]